MNTEELKRLQRLEQRADYLSTLVKILVDSPDLLRLPWGLPQDVREAGEDAIDELDVPLSLHAHDARGPRAREGS